MESANLPPHPESALQNVAWARSLARSLVRGSGDADEVVQETWFRVLRNPPPKGAEPRSWMAAVMRRVVSDGYRQESRRKRREERFATERSTVTDERHAREIEVHTDLVARVMELDDPLRRVVLLRYFDGLPVAEIAKAEGLRTAGVKSRLRRAHEQLRARLNSSPESPAGAWLALQLAIPPGALPATAAKGTSTLLGFWTMKLATFAALLVGTLALVLALHSGDGLEDPGPVVPQARRASSAPQEPSLVATSPVRLATPAEPDPLRRANQAAELAEPEDPEPAAALGGVTILVLAEDGSPEGGIPVCIATSKEGSPNLWYGVTDPQTGRVDTGLDWLDRYGAKDPQASLFVSLDAPFPGVDPIRIDPAALPTEAVELRIPSARGSLEFQCLGEEGAPLAIKFIKIHMAGEAPDTLSYIRRDRAGRTSFTFDPIALGCELQVQAHAPAPWGPIEKVLTGPTVAGEHRVVQLQFTRTRPSIRGRLVTRDGSPLALSTLVQGSVRLLEEDARPMPLIFVLEEDNRFLTHLQRSFEPDQPCEYSFLPKLDEGSQPLKASLIGRTPAPGEVIDLGDIEVNRKVTVGGGRVVDELGQGVAGAIVFLQARDEGSIQAAISAFSAPRMTSRDDGTFDLGQLPEEGEFNLVATKIGYARSVPIPVDFGSSGLELKLRQGREIAGRLLLPEGIDPQSLTLMVTTENGPEKLSAVPIIPRSDGGFGRISLPDHPLRLSIHGARYGPELHALEGIQPRLPGSDPDPALHPIDLTERLRPINLRVEHLDGTAVAEGYLSVDRKAFAIEGGSIQVAVLQQPATVVIGAPGCRRQSFPLSALPEQVTLLPGYPVRLIAPDPWPESLDRNDVEVSLWPKGKEHPRGMIYRAKDNALGSLPMFEAQSASFQGGQAVEILVPAPGEYSVAWTKSPRSPRSSRRQLVPGRKMRIEVQNDEDVQEFALPADN